MLGTICLLILVFLLFACEANGNKIFRVALVSEFSGNFEGNSRNFIEGFRDFVVPQINSIFGGIPVAGDPNQTYRFEVIDYDTESSADNVEKCVKAAASGVDMAGRAVGDVHAIVAGTGKLNKAMFPAAQAAGLVNIHTSGGNPTMWLSTNTYAYGLHLPFIWYTRGPIRLAAANGAKTIAIIRSNAHGFSKASCIAAIQWALDADLTIIGPSVNWCKVNMAKSGGCQIIDDRCVCASQAEVNAFDGLSYDIQSTPNFYQLDENLIGNGLVWREVDANTTSYVQSMFKDMLNQGSMPDVILNFATEWHNVLKAMVEEQVSPMILLGWQGGTTVNWAKPQVDEVTSDSLTEIDGYWAVGFGQWHSAMKFTDPVFQTNARAVSMFETERGRPLDYDTAGAIAAGVVLYTALSRHFKQDFSSLSLTEKRDAVKKAMGDLNDETMWGTLLFNSGHQNIGRGTAAWQVIPNAKKEPQQLCVLPGEAAETLMVIPFPSWASRAGCQAGEYNSGFACELCQRGRASNETTPGLEKSACTQCPAGQGTDLQGMLSCTPCLPGRSQDGDKDDGICQNCKKGLYQDQAGKTSCDLCSLGSYTDVEGQPRCSLCLPGSFQNNFGQSECSACQRGSSSALNGSSLCMNCPRGRFAPEKNMTNCISCPERFTTEDIASIDQTQCLCPEGSYRAEGGLNCLRCPTGMDCTMGSDVANFGTTKPFPLLKAGFWSDPSGDFLSVFQCDSNKKCPGGPPGACAPRLETGSCSKCMKGYSWDGAACVECSSSDVSFMLYTLVPLIVMPIVILVMYNVFSDDLSRWGSYGNGIATVLYLILNHYQVISIISAVVNMPSAPNMVKDLLEIWTFTNDVGTVPWTDSFLNTQCAGLRSFDAILVYQVLIPIVLLAITLVIFIVSKMLALVTRRSTLAMDHNRLFNAFMSLMFTFFNAIAALSLKLFKCVDNPNGKKTLAADYSIVCGSEEWTQTLVIAIFAILVYLVGFASLLLWAICVATSKIHDEGFQMRWKFLFIKFRLDHWWWAMLYLAKGLLYNLGFVIFLESVEQLFWLLFLTSAYTIAVCSFIPYRHRITTLVDGMVCSSIMYVCTFKMWFAPRKDGDLDLAVARVLVICSFAPILLGGGVVFYMLWNLHLRQDVEKRKLKVQCGHFLKFVAELADTEADVLGHMFRTISEWDRWYIMQCVKLVKGERALGVIGHAHRKTFSFGNSKSNVFESSGGANTDTEQSSTANMESESQSDAKQNAIHDVNEEVESTAQDQVRQDTIRDMECDMLLIKEGHFVPLPSPKGGSTPRMTTRPKTPRMTTRPK